MKKLLFLSIIIFSTSVTLAQQGSWYLGGQVGIGSNKEEDAFSELKTTTWNISPEVGTFLMNDIQIGFALNISGAKEKDDQGVEQKTSAFSPVVYARKFFTITDGFSVFAGLDLNYTTGKFTDASNQDTNISGFGTNVNVGLAYALSPRFAIVGKYGLIGYESLKVKDPGGNEFKTRDFGLNVNTLGPVFNVGIYYTFKQ